MLGRKLEGVWHSGIEVYGFEYFYGGGIVKMRPQNVEATFGISPAQVHLLGVTKLTRMDFEKYLLSIMEMFRKEVYDLQNWNCNHFSDHCANFLVSRSIPNYILDLPFEVCKSVIGKLLMSFIKMLQGGAAPIRIDDPRHPSQAPGLRRRNSCPAVSPSSKYHMAANSGPGTVPAFGFGMSSADRARSAIGSGPGGDRGSLPVKRLAMRRRTVFVPTESERQRLTQSFEKGVAPEASGSNFTTTLPVSRTMKTERERERERERGGGEGGFVYGDSMGATTRETTRESTRDGRGERGSERSERVLLPAPTSSDGQRPYGITHRRSSRRGRGDDRDGTEGRQGREERDGRDGREERKIAFDLGYGSFMENEVEEEDDVRIIAYSNIAHMSVGVPFSPKHKELYEIQKNRFAQCGPAMQPRSSRGERGASRSQTKSLSLAPIRSSA